jgi:hypothetical protein
MDELEQSMSAILVKNHESFSAMARRGYSKHGRGAIFVWESEGQKPFTTYRSSYLAQSDHAFLKAGPHPVEMTRAYDPSSEFVTVFVGTDEDIHTVRVNLAKESEESQFEV